jgi:transcriptional regulator with GAF, ATPase, and Fis domain
MISRHEKGAVHRGQYGSFAQGLVESELLVAKRSFTGADARKRGRFALAEENITWMS